MSVSLSWTARVPLGAPASSLFLVQPIAVGLGNPGHVTDGIQQDFRVQRPAQGTGVIELVGPVGVVDGAGQLIGLGTDDPAEQLPQVVAVTGKVFGQLPQQLRMGGRVVAAEVIHRIHDASAEEVTPEAIDGGLGEIGVGRHPLGQLAPGKPGPAVRHPVAVQQGGRHLLAGAGVEDRGARSDWGRRRRLPGHRGCRRPPIPDWPPSLNIDPKKAAMPQN